MVIMIVVIVAGMIMPLVIVARMVIMIVVIVAGRIVLARSVRVGACVRHGNHLSLTCLATDQEVYPRWPNPTREQCRGPKPSASRSSGGYRVGPGPRCRGGSDMVTEVGG